MRIRKYIASTMKEALEDMRRELGEDAVILSSRTLPRSSSNGKEAVELTAAMDNADVTSTKRPVLANENPTPFARDILQFAESYARELPATTPRNGNGRHKQTPQVQIKEVPTLNNEAPLQQTTAFIRLQEELSSMRDTLHSVAGEVRYKHSASLTPTCRKIYKALIDGHLRETLALEVLGNVTAQGMSGNLAEAVQAARKFLAGKISIGNSLQVEGKRNVVAFVGPTGVGKTTTIAKLATAMHLLGGTKVMLISADTYRVGGAEQLETIAAIAGIPFHAVYSSQELRQLLRENTSANYVFIDTVGRSPKNTGHIQEIGAYMEAAAPNRIFLVQSATASEAMFTQTIERFGIIQPTDLILTKLDETPVIGPVLGGLHTRALPLAYITTGQSIPDDIELASRRILAEMLLPLELESEEEEVTIE